MNGSSRTKPRICLQCLYTFDRSVAWIRWVRVDLVTVEEAYDACSSVQSKFIVPLLVDLYPSENSSLHPVATKWALEFFFHHDSEVGHC